MRKRPPDSHSSRPCSPRRSPRLKALLRSRRTGSDCTVETDIQREVRRQQKWLLDNFPSAEAFRQDVIEALDSLRAANEPGEAYFKACLFMRLRSFSLDRPPRPSDSRSPSLKVDFSTAVSLDEIKLVGTGTRFEDTAISMQWSSARNSSNMQERPDDSSSTSPLDSRYISTVRSSRTPTNSLIKFGPLYPTAGLEVHIASSCGQPRYHALVETFEVKGYPLRTGSTGNERLRTDAGTTERYDRYCQQRTALNQCMAYCLAHRQMGRSGMGIAIAGESFSRMWAISPTEIVVEVSKAVWDAVHAPTTTRTSLFPPSDLQPVLAHSFLDGVEWDAEEYISDVNIRAVELFRNFCLLGLSLVSKINGPDGPIAFPADFPSSNLLQDEVSGIGCSAATQTHRLYQILRGESLSEPPEPFVLTDEHTADSDELAPEDSISNHGAEHRRQSIAAKTVQQSMEAGNLIVRTCLQMEAYPPWAESSSRLPRC